MKFNLVIHLPQPPADEHSELKKAFESGATIQINTGTKQAPVWHDTPNPKWIAGEKYRVKPDEYADLKAAHAAGKVIQYRSVTCPEWTDLISISWNPSDWDCKPEYRIKPWTLSRHIPGFRPLEDGEEWQKNVKWTEEMLPNGTRPLLEGEIRDEIDERDLGEADWRKCQEGQVGTPCLDLSVPWRTTRPLPPVTSKDTYSPALLARIDAAIAELNKIKEEITK